MRPVNAIPQLPSSLESAVRAPAPHLVLRAAGRLQQRVLESWRPEEASVLVRRTAGGGWKVGGGPEPFSCRERDLDCAGRREPWASPPPSRPPPRPLLPGQVQNALSLGESVAGALNYSSAEPGSGGGGGR